VKAFCDQLGRLAPPPVHLPAAVDAAQRCAERPPGSARLAAGGAAGGPVAQPRSCSCSWWTNCPSCDGLGGSRGHWSAGGRNDSAGAAPPCRCWLLSEFEATALTATNAPLTSSHLLSVATVFRGSWSAPKTPWGPCACATPLGIFAERTCRRRKACWPRPSTRLAANLPHPTRPGALEGLRTGRVV